MRRATAQVIDAVQEAPGCRIEELVRRCTECSWHDVFEALSRLKRDGRLELVSNELGIYHVALGARRPRTVKHR